MEEDLPQDAETPGATGEVLPGDSAQGHCLALDVLTTFSAGKNKGKLKRARSNHEAQALILIPTCIPEVVLDESDPN